MKLWCRWLDLAPTGSVKLTEHPPKEPDKPYRVVWTLAKEHLGKPERTGLVPVVLNDGHWELKPLGEKRVEVTYYVYTDPGGLLPKFMANMAQRQSVPKVIFAVRKRAAEILKRMEKERRRTAKENRGAATQAR